MTSNGIRAIIFDIGRVLVRIDLRRVQQKLTDGLPLNPQELWSAIEKDPHWKDWQEGRLSPRDWHLNLCKRFGITLGFDDFVNAWNSTLDPNPIHSNTLFAGLSNHYKLGLLSNTDPIHVSFLENTYRFFDYFPKPVRIYSCAVGASKPEPLIFQQVLRACKVTAQQAIFVDDIGAFTQAAESLGMRGIQYFSPEQLLSDFQRLGVHM